MLVPLPYSASLGLYSASPGPYGSCTYLPLFALIPVPLVQLNSTGIVPFARVLNVPTCPCLYRTYAALLSLYSVLLWATRAMYVSSCLDSRAVTVSLLPLTWTVCWQCRASICAGCLYLTCRGAVVCLPVCTANREGWQPRLIYTMYIIHNDFHVLCSTSSVVGVR